MVPLFNGQNQNAYNLIEQIYIPISYPETKMQKPY